MGNNGLPETVEPERYLVFISHASKDKWIARQIVKEIEAKGKRFNVATFLDAKDIEIGESIHEAIRTNLNACNELIVLLSPHSISRQWVLFEIGGAWTAGKRVVPILIGLLPEEMPDILRQLKAIEMNDFETYLEEITQRAKEAKNA